MGPLHDVCGWQTKHEASSHDTNKLVYSSRHDLARSRHSTQACFPSLPAHHAWLVASSSWPIKRLLQWLEPGLLSKHGMAASISFCLAAAVWLGYCTAASPQKLLHKVLA